MIDNMQIYLACKDVPAEAQKTIGGGKLKGFTDINPMWRIRKLTELFGPAGVGWWTEEVHYETYSAPGGEVPLMCSLVLYYTDPATGERSKPLYGVGGSKLVSLEKGVPVADDEAWKKAYTDAISIACKALGMGGAIYWDRGDGSKYAVRTSTGTETRTAPAATQGAAPGYDRNAAGQAVFAELGLRMDSKEDLRRFSEMLDSLKRNGVVPDKPIKEMTDTEHRQAMAAMIANYRGA